MTRRLSFIVLLCFATYHVQAQFLMDMIDTSKETGKGLLAMYKKFDHIKIGGYIQPQFQVAQSKGIKSYEGGDFSSLVSNRFMLRRSRMRIDFVHFDNKNQPGVQMVFQFDANERSFTVRDVWGRVFENKFKLFSLTTGMFARPFGFETNLSSGDRESPERGRMNQILMRSERDLGAMISFDSRRSGHKLKHLKIDLGVFNGQGINAPGEFDNSKDFIGRISLKPYKLSKRVSLSAGASVLIGALTNNTKYVYTTNGDKKEVVDSTVTNRGSNSPRKYFGIDAQLKIKHRNNIYTELRGELIGGTQTGTATASETPTALLTGFDGFHVRNFFGGYFYFLQNICSNQHQFIIKYDWYDPNAKVQGKDIGVTGAGLSAANIKYSTIGFGYIEHLSENAKLVLYYAKVFNEKTALAGYTKDLADDVFTCRLQFRF